MTLSIGEVLHDRYRIEALLGEGGFGAVYKAWDENLNGPCAIKENFETSAEAQKQFAREASMLFNLRHPNLPRVFDTFSIQGQGQYLVMDFIEGENLQAMLDRSAGGLPTQQVLRWIGQVCDALEYLHGLTPPVVHRDIKPANIRITPAGQAMLVDFGIAKLFDPQLRTTKAAQAVTPGFSPPEQYGAGSTDERSDLYALAATLYNLLTGQAPPVSVDILAGVTAPLQLAHLVNPSVPQGVSQAIEKAMVPNRTQRMAKVAEFHSALQRSSTPLPPTLVAPTPDQVAGQKETVQVSSPLPGQIASHPPVEVAPPRQPLAKPARGRKAAEPHPRRWLPWAILGAVILGVGALALVGISFLPSILGNEEEKAGGTPPTHALPEQLPTERQVTQPQLPTQLPPVISGPSGQVTLWHGYFPDSIAEAAFLELVETAQQEFPDLNILVEYVDWTTIGDRLLEEVSKGSGPDIIVTNTDDLGNWVRLGLLADLTDMQPWQEFSELANDGVRREGRAYAIPLSLNYVTLYFDNSQVAYPPADSGALLDLVSQGKKIVLLLDPYFLFGFSTAAGGILLDETGRCIADQGGWADMLIYLLDLKNAGALVETEYGSAKEKFLNGEAVMMLDGPWSFAEYRGHFGERLGLAPLPSGPGGPSRPLVGFEVVYINSRTSNMDASKVIATFLTSSPSSQKFMQNAMVPPVRLGLRSQDPLLDLIIKFSEDGFLRPQIPEFNNFWGPFGEMYMAVFFGGVSPQEAVAQACAVMNQANEK